MICNNINKIFGISIFSFVLTILLSIFTACIQENPNLVDPPSIMETVNIRFLNLANDEQPRTMYLDRQHITTNHNFNTLSNSHHPPFDSVTIQVFKGENKTYTSEQKFKFARISNYILIALPNFTQSYNPNIEPKEDTVIYLQTTILKPNDSNQCYVKFLNANPDTISTYSIKIGCPNGEHLFSDNNITNVRFLQNTGTQPIYEGKRVISIIKNTQSIITDPEEPDLPTYQSQLIGIFELNLTRLGQYALIVNKFDEVFFINELDHNSPFIKLYSVNDRNAYVRVINLSQETISVTADAAGDLATNLQPKFINNYTIISTCDAMNLDKISLIHNNQTNDSLYISFDIYKQYSLVAFDNDEQNAAMLIAVPPVDDRMGKRNDKAIVRVVNGNYSKSGITVSFGARTADTNIGYISGTTIAVDLYEGEYSQEMYIDGGTSLPLAIFATTQPTTYLFSGLINIENGKEYIIAIDKLNNGTITTIELNDQQIQPQYAEQTAFFQFANVTTNNINFSIPNIVTNGMLTKNNLLATFLPLNNINLQIAGNNFTLNNNLISDRTLLIACGNANQPETFVLQGQTMGADHYSVRWRFINATTDVPSFDVYEIVSISTDPYTRQRDTQFAPVNLNVVNKTASNINFHSRDKKYSFIFRNQANNIRLYSANDLLLTLAKNYSIILYGRKDDYGILIVQEY